MAKIFAYQPCIGCVKCQGGVKGLGRMSWVPWVHLMTLGITYLMAKSMRCPRCSHTRFGNSHQPIGNV